MQVTRYLKAAQVRLGLAHGHPDEIVVPEGLDAAASAARLRKERERLKLEVIHELAELFNVGGQIRNLSKFTKDFVHRENKSSTAIGGGVAVPHIRSSQPRQMVIIFARSRDGVWFDAPDGEPVHFFFGITAPEYDDPSLYLEFYRWFGRSFRDAPWLPEALMEARDEHEIVAILSRLPN